MIGDVTSLADGHRLAGTWSSDLPSSGSVYLTRNDPDLPSGIAAQKITWNEFKKVQRRPQDRIVYRGQPQPDRLRTAFHRGGRADIFTFARKDIGQLQRAVSAVIPHVFALDKADEHTALMALAQHHGYPTPLLDWTLSPYVAAYFAVRDVLREREINPRVFELHADNLVRSVPPLPDLVSPLPSIRLLDPIPVHNPRLVPQQSIVAFTTIDDIEAYLLHIERNLNVQLISAYDITPIRRKFSPSCGSWVSTPDPCFRASMERAVL